MKYIVALMAPAFVCGTLEVEAEDEDEARDSSNNGYACGDRVQTHPATDAWMRGDRYGDVVYVTAKKIKVKLDRSGRTVAFYPRDLIQVTSSSEAE